MLNFFRSKAKSWVVKLLLGFLALTFAIWGVGDYVNSDAQKPVAEINGQPVSQREFAMAYDNDIERMREMFGGKLDKATAERLGVKDQSLALMVNRMLVHQEIRKLRLAVSPNSLQQMIATTPAFQVDGHFNNERYAAVLRSTRLSPLEYEAQLAGDVLAGQYERTMRMVTAVPDALVEEIYRMEQEKRGADLLTLNSADLAREVQITDAALEAYLKENGDAFQTPVKVKVRYALLDVDSVKDQVTISDEEIQTHYNELAAESEQKEIRHLRHIQVESDGTPAGEQQAQATIAEAQKALAGGMTFAEAAKRFSRDAITAEVGGDLGELTRGAVGSDEFDAAAFALAKGAVSQPVKTAQGYHLIYVESIQSGGVKPLEQMREEIRQQLALTKAQELVYDRSAKLEDQLYASGDLRAVAQGMNLRYRETGVLDFEKPEGLVGIEALPKFQETALATARGSMSPMVELEDARFFVLEVVEREEPRPLTLAEARGAVEKGFRADEARKLAKARMEGVLKKLQEGRDWAATVQAAPGVKFVRVEPFVFGDEKATASPATQRVLFRLTPDAPVHPLVLDEGDVFHIVRLGPVVAADMQAYAEDKAEMRKRMEGELGSDQFNAILSSLGKQAEIIVNEDVLKRF